VKHLRAE